jgi:sugar lactone lactonase YvrE
MKYFFIILITFFCSISISAQTVTTFVGGCSELYHGFLDATGTAARFYYPTAITVDTHGTFYVADSGNNVIRKITPNGVVTTLAGSVSNQPSGVAVDTTGNVYISDTFNNRILKINFGSNVAHTIAGSGTAGNADGIGIAAEFNTPKGIAVDINGNLFVADTYNNRIRKIDTNGLVTTIAGSSAGNSNGFGASAQFALPCGVALDSAGNLFVADTGNNLIKKIGTDGMVSTYIGNGIGGDTDGIGPNASLNRPISLAIDSNNVIYFVSKNENLIRRVTPAGEVTTIAGYYETWGSCSNGIGTNAQFLHPEGLVINPTGNIYIADTGSHTIRKISNLLSTNENQIENQIEFFPNPATDNITFHFADITNSKITILDMNGRVLQKNSISENNTTIDISNLSKGFYLIQIATNKGFISKKIIKE